MSVEQRIAALKARTFNTTAKTLRRIASAFESNSDGLELEFIKISIICPLSKKRIVTPCRSYGCSHLACFDASTYYKMNEGRKFYQHAQSWKCPICSVKAPFNFLEFDRFLDEILHSENLPIEAEEIILQKDGTWSVEGSGDKSFNVSCIDLTEDSFIGSDHEELGENITLRSASTVKNQSNNLFSPRPSKMIASTPTDITPTVSASTTFVPTTSGGNVPTTSNPQNPSQNKNLQNPSTGNNNNNRTITALTNVNLNFEWQPYNNEEPGGAIHTRHHSRQNRRTNQIWNWNRSNNHGTNGQAEQTMVWVEIPRGPGYIRLRNIGAWTKRESVYHLIRTFTGPPLDFSYFPEIGHAYFRLGFDQDESRAIMEKLNGMRFQGRVIVAEVSIDQFDFKSWETYPSRA